ncbi:unnamed protein product [Trifolium pratense]|uniref:Uncharacterized protein n=1 Tax=Trifolium pratense TaxID=57577 RepID=A0ACB0JGA7_TRIPR|nr:unnamed protein product [Trifolium pratense]
MFRATSYCGHSTRSTKLEDKEHKRVIDGAKEKERYKEKYIENSFRNLTLVTAKRCFLLY